MVDTLTKTEVDMWTALCLPMSEITRAALDPLTDGQGENYILIVTPTEVCIVEVIIDDDADKLVLPLETFKEALQVPGGLARALALLRDY